MIWIEARLQRDGLEKSVFMHNITFQSHALYPQLGGADVFLDRPHFVGNKPKLILYCIGLMPPKDILIRSSLYQ